MREFPLLSHLSFSVPSSGFSIPSTYSASTGGETSPTGMHSQAARSPRGVRRAGQIVDDCAAVAKTGEGKRGTL